MGKGQYIGISDHLVLTLMEDRYLSGLLAHAVDLPMTPNGKQVYWCGGVTAQPWKGDIYYQIHPLFFRDPDYLLAQARDIQIEAHITGMAGRVSNRQYWLVEIPALTSEVLLNLDEITIVQRRKKFKPTRPRRSLVSRGEFWQTGAFQEHPVYKAKRELGDNDGQDDPGNQECVDGIQMAVQTEGGDGG